MNVALTLEARSALSLNQRTLAEMLGISARTVQRWDARRSEPARSDWHAMARAVHPIDAELAERLAKEGRSSLEELGLVGAAAPAPPSSAYELHHLADAVVCAAAEAIDLPPRAIRQALIAAFRRARQMRLSVEDMESALAGKDAGEKRQGSAKADRKKA